MIVLKWDWNGRLVTRGSNFPSDWSGCKSSQVSFLKSNLHRLRLMDLGSLFNSIVKEKFSLLLYCLISCKALNGSRDVTFWIKGKGIWIKLSSLLLGHSKAKSFNVWQLRFVTSATPIPLKWNFYKVYRVQFLFLELFPNLYI